MKIIYLIRHAKSSWDFPQLSDHQRPLSQRGEKDARIMSAELFKTGFEWPQVYVSTAQRARLTIQTLSDSWPNKQSKPNEIQISDDLYTFSSDAIWQFIHGLDPELDSILLVGHNPAFTNFINEASENELQNLPTCGFVKLVSARTSWHQLQLGDFQLKKMLKPKMYK